MPSKEELLRFNERRKELNDLVMQYADLNIKKFFNLDWRIYRDGALDAKTKELLGLVASIVLRCDDCITYHLLRCKELGYTDRQITEAVSVAMVVGGSITIPHIRRLFEQLDAMSQKND